jgi:hypothetical protein
MDGRWIFLSLSHIGVYGIWSVLPSYVLYSTVLQNVSIGRRRESPGDLRSRQASNGRHLDACVSTDAAQLAVTVPSIRLPQVQYI